MKSLAGPCEKDLAQLFAVNKKLKSLKITKGYHMSGRCLLQLPGETIEEIDLHNGIAVMPGYMDEVRFFPFFKHFYSFFLLLSYLLMFVKIIIVNFVAIFFRIRCSNGCSLFSRVQGSEEV